MNRINQERIGINNKIPTGQGEMNTINEDNKNSKAIRNDSKSYKVCM